MIKYQLKYEELVPRNIHSDFKVVEAADNATIQKCIDLFNLEVQWNGMFDIQEALYRIGQGEKMFVGYKNKDIFCYCWIKPYNERGYYLYNVFCKKPSSLRKIGVIDMLYLVIKDYTKALITVDIDDWNNESQKVAKRLGFERE